KPELGSGCVKITPAHDPNDYEVGKRCGLDMINILNPDGTLNSNAGKYQGLTIKSARNAVVEDLDELQLLGDVEAREIELPLSDRSKTPIEPYLADQWFVAMAELAQTAIDAVEEERVEIFPARYRRSYIDWLSEKRDWPVSRQLWWGHRIPIWSALSRTPAAAEELRGQLQPLVQQYPEQIAIQSDVDPEADQATGNTHVFVCIRDENAELEALVLQLGLEQDPDVLDTWFSSALWPHSTLGWPNQTEDLEYYYPTSTLITSRDIITLWVARMVLMGMNNVGEVPFREVFIHPKILDGNGQTMSKSKGNGVDPIDVINKFGPDALRFGLARLATDTQDVRMPVQFECPYCDHRIDQTTKNRKLAVIPCEKCGKSFSTQWAESEEDKSHTRGTVVSERFETARNFCNKLWNAARFVMQNLDDMVATDLDRGSLPLEDRWLLSRLATVTEHVDKALQHYKFADAAATLYDFAWDDFCSFYVEMAKPRLADASQRGQIQNLIAGALDQLLRLLHPMIPFLTESIWQHLGEVAPRRGLQSPTRAAEQLMVAPWPVANLADRDTDIELQFQTFQEVLGAVRKIRSSQNIAPRERVPVSIRCTGDNVDLLRPMAAYFESLAGAEVEFETAERFGSAAQPFEINAPMTLAALDIDVYVDLAQFIDIDAERERLQRLIDQREKQMVGKQKKLSNENFVARAPAEVVQTICFSR
ncbi:MAG: class I tRNA ligase family protein, partial [Planctomycetota bacterium]